LGIKCISFYKPFLSQALNILQVTTTTWAERRTLYVLNRNKNCSVLTNFVNVPQYQAILK
jgi:hypothetical protein